MADEIRLNVNLNVEKGGFKANIAPGAVVMDQALQGAHRPVVVVGTAEEDLALGDLSVPGLVMIKNLDPANFVTYGPKDTTMTLFGKLLPGEVAVFRLGASVTMCWKADTAAVRVQVDAFET